MAKVLPLSLFQVPLNEIMIHVEKAKPDLVEDHVQFVADRYGLFSNLTKLAKCIILCEKTEPKSTKYSVVITHNNNML